MPLPAKNTTMSGYFYNQTRTQPEKVKRQILGMAREAIGNEMVDKHFTPATTPGISACVSFPMAISIKPSIMALPKVVTGDIETWTESGLTMTDGTEIDADIIVTATG